MYTLEILKEGVKYLNITDHDVISGIIKSNIENIQFHKEYEEQKEVENKYKQRFIVPRGLSKKEYTLLLKDTQERIDSLIKDIRILLSENKEIVFLDIEKEQYIEKKNNIKKILQFYGKEKKDINIDKAKQFPIEELLEFTNGFTQCIFHTEKTGSLKLYTDKNRAHCFGCHKDVDSIDIYMQLYNVSFVEAVKKLS